MELVPRWFRRVYAGGYAQLVTRAPLLMGWIYDRLDDPRRGWLDRPRQGIERRALGALRRRLERGAPEAIIHTHFLAPAPVAEWIAGRHSSIRQAVVITDMYPHRVWMAPGIDQYFVATQYARDCLIAGGVEPPRVTVSGIPVLAKHQVQVD